MSAIWGYLSYTNTIPDELPARMEAPYHVKCCIDRYDTKQNEFLTMGCGIQYITQEARLEVLPVFDAENGIFFTADCILDNRAELITLLASHDITANGFRSDASDASLPNASLSAAPDGTLMYLAYKAWGIDCLKQFRGLFSMAVYNAKAETLFLATDQTASRCLYYYQTADSVCFSTLLEPIRRVCPNLPFNEYYLKDYLAAPGLMPNIVPTETPYAGVFKINPGCYIAITKDTITEHSYWSPFAPESNSVCTAKTPHPHSAKAYGNAFRALYTECVTDALRTAGEVGISMSSGLDSAGVGALAATALRDEKKTLYAYTYVPCEAPEPSKNNSFVHDETSDVLKIVNMHPNIKPHFLTNNKKNCLTFLEKGLDIMEIPFKAIVNLPNLYEVYCRAQEDNCRIVLTGQTGNATVSHGYIDDVLFDDYRRGHFLRFLRYLNKHSKHVKLSRKKELQACIRYFRHVKSVYRNNGIRDLTPDNPFLAGDILNAYPYPERYAEGELPFLESVPTSQDIYPMYLYNKAALTYLGELDTKLGLAAGVLLRDPTRDPRMIAFCADLPYHLFAYKGTPRWLTRGNLADLLPADILDDWMRYGVQNSDWLQRIRRDWTTVATDLTKFFNTYEQSEQEPPCIKHLIDTEKIRNYLHSVPESGPDTDSFKFNCLTFVLLFILFAKQ